MEAAKLHALRTIIEQVIPFNRLLGLHLEDAGDGTARGRFDFKDELVGNPVTRVLHGGVIAAVLDVIGASAVMSTFEDGASLAGMGTVDMRVDYLRPGAGAYFIATGQVMRPGRILSAARMELCNDAGVLIAIGTAIYRASRKPVQAPPNL
ncbi:MAG TPA: thioesterase family protein [bacterium]|nr:thioesterase family protein [bacterium]